MAKKMRFALVVLLTGAILGGAVTEAAAQVYPPPIPCPPGFKTINKPPFCKAPKEIKRCLKHKRSWVIGEVERVKGGRRCELLAPGETVNVFLRVQGSLIFLGTATVDSRGRYKLFITVPNTPIGIYEVVINPGPGEIRDFVEIRNASAVLPAGNGGRTPGGYAALSLWIVALLGIGLAVVFAPRRALSWVPLRTTLGRLRSTSRPPALPEPDVPFLDTRAFVPTRPAEEPKGDTGDRPEDRI